MAEKLKAIAKEIIWTELVAGYTFRQIAEFYEISQPVANRIANGNLYSVDIAIKVLEKHGFKIEVRR